MSNLSPEEARFEEMIRRTVEQCKRDHAEHVLMMRLYWTVLVLIVFAVFGLLHYG
jgi:hypothetical protein